MNDRIMDTAQILLRRQFPYISGFDIVLKVQNLNYAYGYERGRFTLADVEHTVDCRPRKKVKFYDSAC